MLLCRLDVDPGPHQAVAGAADLGALDVPLAGLARVEPAGDHASGNRVLLQPEDGHREVVEHVEGLELEVVELLENGVIGKGASDGNGVQRRLQAEELIDEGMPTYHLSSCFRFVFLDLVCVIISDWILGFLFVLCFLLFGYARMDFGVFVLQIWNGLDLGFRMLIRKYEWFSCLAFLTLEK